LSSRGKGYIWGTALKADQQVPSSPRQERKNKRASANVFRTLDSEPCSRLCAFARDVSVFSILRFYGYLID
jgi:hypothetical protein